MTSNTKQGQSGGAAAQAGSRYEASVAGWYCARLLAGAAAHPPLGLPTGTKLTFVRCQTESPVDDVLIETTEGGFIFCQIKSGLRLERGMTSAFGSVIDQFVRQWKASNEGTGNPAWARPVDARDRLVLITTPGSDSVTKVLPRLLGRLRDDHSANTLLMISKTDGERRVAQVTGQLLADWWKITYGETPMPDKLVSLLRTMWVQIFDLEENGTDTLATLDLLRMGVLQEPNDALQAWSTIQRLASRLHSSRSGVNATAVINALITAGIGLRTAPDYQGDVENLCQASARMIKRSQEFSLLVRGKTDTTITREYLQPLRDAASAGSVVLVGEPGAGKSGILYQLAETLSEEGADLIFLSVDSLPVRTTAALRQELRITHDLADILNNWSGSGPGYLILDALDAARNFDAQTVLKGTIADIRAGQTRWHIIASIREYDLLHGTEWQRLFATTGRADAGHTEFRAVDHIYVPRLKPVELAELAHRYPPLEEVLTAGSDRLVTLLTNIFNLHLMAELLERGVDPGSLGAVNTQIQLLDQYWLHRVIRNDDHRDVREAALTRVAERMIEDRVTRVFRADVRGPVASDALVDLERENILRAPEAGGVVLLFAHHILFDYAIERLVFLRGRTPERLVSRLRGAPDLVLMLGPSLSLCFQDLWYLEGQGPFWALAFQLGAARDLPEIAKLSAPMVAAEAAGAIEDFSPLFAALSMNNVNRAAAENFVGHLVGGLLVISGDRGMRLRPWAAVAERLSGFLRDEVAYSLRTLVWKLTDQFDVMSASEQVNVGIAARRLLEYAWRRPIRDGSLVIAAIEAVTKTFTSNIADSISLLRQALEPNHMAQFAYEELPWVARGIATIIESAPDFAAEIYVAAFRHEESSDAATSLGNSQILPLTSNRRQDYRGTWYALEQAFPSFLRAAQASAIRALIASTAAYVETKHAYSADNRPETLTFDLAGTAARVRADYSAAWNPRGRQPFDDVQKLLAHFARFLDNLATESGAGKQFRDIVRIVAEENELAVIWRYLLSAATTSPDIFAEFVAPLASAEPILVGVDTTFEAGRFINAAYPVLSTDIRERIENAIVNIPTNNRQAVLLGCVPENLIVTDRVREARRIIAEKRGIPANRPLFEMGTAWRQEYTSEMELEEQGVNLGAPENQQLRAAANEVEKFWKGHLNQSPSEDATDTALALFRQLLSALRASTVPAADDRLREHAWSVLAEATARVAQNREVVQDEPVRSLLKEIIFGAGACRTPESSPEHDEQFDHSISWGGPSARIGAAEGAMSLAFYVPATLDEMLPFIQHLLTEDPAPEVRYQISSRLHLLLDSRPDWVWTHSKKIVEREPNRGVIIGVLSQPVAYLASRDPDRGAYLALHILDRFAEDFTEGARQCIDLALSLLSDLYIVSDHPRSREAIFDLFADPVANNHGIKLLLTRYGGGLVEGKESDPDDPVRRCRSFGQLPGRIS